MIRALPSHSHHLVEYEVVTVKHLVAKIHNSFTAGTGQARDERDGASHGQLPEAPVFLVGVLLSSAVCSSVGEYTGLLLGDVTENIPCEVSA